MEHAQNGGTRTAAADFFDAVAVRILAHHLAPDLRDVIVLLPNHHVAKPLAQALVRTAGMPAVLLPQMRTLDEWTGQVTLSSPVTPASLRLVTLYQALHERRWFENADLWSMARELLGLFDELTAAMSELPRDLETFTQSLQQAYQARQNEAMQFEARLVFELWHAMMEGSQLDALRASQQRLAKLAEQADMPMFVLRTSDWNAMEQRFLDRYAERASVTVFDLRQMLHAEHAALNLLVADQAGTGGQSSLRALAEKLRGQVAPPLTGRLRFFAAHSLEEEARAAAMQVRLWLQAGKQDIAIVAQDRVVARRVRALLERAQILVQDETGWTFATLSVSTVLMRWLDVLQSDFYHHDLLDLLKSPFIFAETAPAQRKAMAYQLEQLLRHHGVVSGLENFMMLADGELTLQQALAQFSKARAILDTERRQTIAGWLQALSTTLELLGIESGLRRDAAGSKLLEALQGWQDELEGDDMSLRFAEWRRWFAQQLDDKTFRDAGIESPVRLTHLAATRWRVFDAVLLIGCDTDHLPAVSDGSCWFNDAVRGSLGLPTRAQHVALQRDDLFGLLLLNDQVLVTWQQERNGEQVLLSPFLEMLRDLHALAYGDTLAENELKSYLALEQARTAELPPTLRPAPRVARQLPGSITVGAYNSLVACPYQFHARHILRLNELDEVQETIEKRDYGELVHKILQRFFERYPEVGSRPDAEMQQALRELSAVEFADQVEQDFSARAWLVRWLKSLPAWLEWQRKCESLGWRHMDSEQTFDVDLAGVRLRGRIDRIDERETDRRVLDYKTNDVQTLRNKLKQPGEDVQLACYAWARQAQDAAFVSIDNGEVKEVAPKEELHALAQANVNRLQQVMLAMREGVQLPANGIDMACQYCEMRGLCRRGEWRDG